MSSVPFSVPKEWNEVEARERLWRAVAVTNMVLAAQGVAGQYAEKALPKWLDVGDKEWVPPVVASTVIELTKSVADGKLFNQPGQVLTKIATSALITAVTKELGTDSVTAGTAGVVAARWVEVIWDWVKIMKK